MKYQPIAINLNKHRVLIIGGGLVAERKVLSLLKSGGRIQLISPTLTAKLSKLEKAKRFIWVKRLVREKDLRNFRFIITATNNNQVNKDVSRWSKKAKAWINVVDEPNLSNFISPALFKKGEAIVAVYTDGRNPVLSRDLKNFLKEHWDEFLSYRHRLQKRSR